MKFKKEDIIITKDGTVPEKNRFNFHHIKCKCAQCINLRLEYGILETENDINIARSFSQNGGICPHLK